jgi:membrane-associated protein
MLGRVNDALDVILSTVQSVDPALRTLIALLGMFLETSLLIGLIVPGDSIVIVSSTAVRGAIEITVLGIAVVVGSLGGESVGFALGRHFGPSIRRSALGRRIGEHNWVRAENYLDRRGGIAVFVSRFLPLLHSLIPLTVGMSPMRYRRFIAWTAPACIVWASAYITVGVVAAGSYRELSDSLHYAGYIFVAAIVVFFAIAVAVKKLLERSQARHMERTEVARDERNEMS